MKWLLVLAMAGLTVACAAGEAPNMEILGEWRGTSKCVDLDAAPNCKDEVVLYQILPVAGATDRVLLKAYKIVNGIPDLMSDLEFHHRVDTGAWENELETPRYYGLWSFTIKDRHLRGTLVLLPGRKIVRKVETTKS